MGLWPFFTIPVAIFSVILQKSGCFYYLTLNFVVIVAIIFSFSVHNRESNFPDNPKVCQKRDQSVIVRYAEKYVFYFS